MTVRVYQSTDTDAPVLRSNSPGDLIALLNACLVDGYGTKDPAGWTMPFTGTNVAAFKQGVGSNDMYLRIDDSMELSSSGWRYARVVGYEDMSDVDTGTPTSFPTDAQIPGGLYWHTLANGSGPWNDRDTPKSWVVLADEAFFYIWLRNHEYPSNTFYYNQLFFFGDFISDNAADAYNTIIYGANSSTNGNTNGSSSTPFNGAVASSVSGTAIGLYVGRANNQETVALNAGINVDYAKMGGSSTWSAGPNALAFPNPADGSMVTCELGVHDPGGAGTAILRGRLPGAWGVCHFTPDLFSQGDTFAGQGDMQGKEFMCFRGGNYGCIIETSDTWRD